VVLKCALAALTLSGAVAMSCSSSNSGGGATGNTVTCGANTTLQGNTCVGPSGMVTEAGTLDSPPTFAGAVSAAAASDSSLQITWAPGSDDVTPADQLKYDIYVAASAGKENFGQPTAVSPPGAASMVVYNLQPDMAYSIVVRAEDSAGNQDANTTEISGTPTKDTTAPTFAGATAADGTGASTVKVSWAAATDDLTPAEGISYAVYWSDTEAGATAGVLSMITAPGATSAVVDHLPTPSSTYYFYVQARDAAGNASKSPMVVSGMTSADTTPPVFGGCTAAANPGAARATITWLPATDDITTQDKIQYNVYALKDPTDPGTPFGNPQGTFTGVTTGVVQGLMPLTTYYFVCRAQDEAGNEDTNISFRSTTTLEDSQPPDLNGGISNITVEATSATINWNAAKDDQTDTDQIKYVVYQSTDPDASNSGMAVSPGPPLGATSFTVANLASNTTYFWAIVAVDAAGNASAPSDDVSGLTLVSFANDVQPIFTTNCVKSNCHGGGGVIMQGQDLSEGNAYDNIVNAPTRWDTSVSPYWGCTHINRVQPGLTDKSLLWHKINHTAAIAGAATGNCNDKNQGYAFGEGMPKDLCDSGGGGVLNCPKLPQATLDTITLWITQGAENN
jgi:hypothetical protein